MTAITFLFKRNLYLFWINIKAFSSFEEISYLSDKHKKFFLYNCKQFFSLNSETCWVVPAVALFPLLILNLWLKMTTLWFNKLNLLSSSMYCVFNIFLRVNVETSVALLEIIFLNQIQLIKYWFLRFWGRTVAETEWNGRLLQRFVCTGI